MRRRKRTGDSPEFNSDQIRAVEYLQNALSRLNTTGLKLAGIDDGLAVFLTADYETHRVKAPSEYINEVPHVLVHHPVYIDSGGI